MRYSGNFCYLSTDKTMLFLSNFSIVSETTSGKQWPVPPSCLGFTIHSKFVSIHAQPFSNPCSIFFRSMLNLFSIHANRFPIYCQSILIYFWMYSHFLCEVWMLLIDSYGLLLIFSNHQLFFTCTAGLLYCTAQWHYELLISVFFSSLRKFEYYSKSRSRDQC